MVAFCESVILKRDDDDDDDGDICSDAVSKVPPSFAYDTTWQLSVI